MVKLNVTKGKNNMDFQELEKERIKALVQIWLTVIVVVAVICAAIYICLFVAPEPSEYIEPSFLIVTIIFVIATGLVLDKPKRFENNVKTNMGQYALDQIIGIEGQLYWQRPDSNSPDGHSEDITEAYKLSQNASDVLFRRHCTHDDIYYGTYRRTPFSICEYDHSIRHGKNSYKFIYGIVIAIKCQNLKYKNTLVLGRRRFSGSKEWENALVKRLVKVSHGNELAKDVYTDKASGIDEILTPKFIDFANNLDDKYTVAFAEGNLYIIINKQRDWFKMGSLFKRIDDQKQYEKFTEDISYILNIIEQAKMTDITE
ncbi:MAG: DUF3137 domain-containing protein [bacterium]|nr:DUF3137 domain-containing protein [bacterium]